VAVAGSSMTSPLSTAKTVVTMKKMMSSVEMSAMEAVGTGSSSSR
jgi:hypothetical protein